MDLNMSIKVEPAQIKCEEFSIKVENSEQNQEYQLVEHEQSYGEDSSKILVKTEPAEHSDASLYVDHQVKEEIVIGPTQFHKESSGTAGFPCTLCDTIYKHKGSMTRHMWVVHKVTELKPKRKAQKRNEEREKNIKHSRKEFAFIKCGVCIKYFANFSSLDNHMKICPMLKMRQNCDTPTDKSLTVKKVKDNLLFEINKDSKIINIKTDNDIFEKRVKKGNKELCDKKEEFIFKEGRNKDNKEEFIFKKRRNKDNKEESIFKKGRNKDNKDESIFKKGRNGDNKDEFIFKKGGNKDNKEFCDKKEKDIFKKGMNNDKKEFDSKKEIDNIKKEVDSETKQSFDERLDSNSKSRNRCQYCNKTFTFTANLYRHLKQFHSKDSGIKPYACDKCFMKFSRKDYLLRHKLVTHSEVSPKRKIIHCECGKKHFNKWALTQHKKANCPKTLKEGEFFCDYCNKLFHHKYRLTEHIKTHNRKKNLICDYCQRGFRRRFNLIQHICQHTDDYPQMYKCKICNKQFTRNWSLKKHLIAHSGKKPFSCKYCDQRFGSKWGCISHEKMYCLLKKY